MVFPARVVVLVPRRPDGGHRDRLWEYVEGWLDAQCHDWRVVEGHDAGDGPFNRSAAINRAAAEAGFWEAAVILDADTICPPEQMREGVSAALASDELVLPHDHFRSIARVPTMRVLDGRILPSKAEHRWIRKRTKSSCVVVPRSLWERVGGFDEGFQGWGFEDSAFFHAAMRLQGVQRLAGPVHHLWHPRSAEKDPDRAEYQANVARVNRYKAATTAKAMAALIEELSDDAALDAFATGADHP